MKISKIFAGMSALALAASMVSMVSVSADEAISNYEVPAEYIKNNTAYLVGEEAKGENGPFESVADLTGVTSIKYVISIDESKAQDGINAVAWMGGGLGTNSDVLGWNSHEWCFQPYATDKDGNPVDADGDGNPDPVKECTFVKVSDGVYETTLTNPDGFFKEDDGFAQAWLQDWTSDATGGITLTDVVLNPTDADEPATYDVKATIGFADGDWSCQDWATSIDVYQGENELTFKAPLGEDGTPMTSEGATVFVIDLADCFAEIPDLKCEVTSVIVDGKEFPIDLSKVLYGNIEDDKDNYRIELYNAYGETAVNEKYDASVSPFNPDDLTFSDSVTIKFTAEGTGLKTKPVTPVDPSSSEPSSESSSEVSSSETSSETSSATSTSDTSSKAASSSSKAANTSTTTNPNTGAAALAAVGVALAGAAVVASKKRK